MIELAFIAVVLLPLVGVTFTLRRRIDALANERADDHEAVERLRGEVADVLETLVERERDLRRHQEDLREHQEDCGRLAKSTADQRLALYKMTKGLNRSVAQWAHEARAEATAALEEAARVNADPRQQRETIADVIADPRVKRLLNERTLPSIG